MHQILRKLANAPPNCATYIRFLNVMLVGGFNPIRKNNMLVKLGIFPKVGLKLKKIFETTGHVERTVLVPRLIDKVSFHLSYEHYNLKPPPSMFLFFQPYPPINSTTRLAWTQRKTPEALLASVNISTSCIGHNGWKAHPCTCPKESTQLQVKDLQLEQFWIQV